MIVVTTPTGKIGSQVVDGLLEAGEAVRVIVRDATKLPPAVRGRVEVVEGSHDDAAVVARACAGADRFFLLVPPSFTTTDSAAYYAGFTAPLISAIESGAVKRVVGCVGVRAGRAAAGGGPSRTPWPRTRRSSGPAWAFRALWCPGVLREHVAERGHDQAPGGRSAGRACRT